MRQVCAAHPEAFGPPPDTIDSRRLALLKQEILPALNRVDQGQWGLLVKLDQGGKIPCDIAVFRDTMEHFDVMTGSGATWLPLGVPTNPAWQWLAVDMATLPDPPASEPSAPVLSAAIDPTPILEALARVEGRLAALEAQIAHPPTYATTAGPWRIILKPQW